MHADATPHPLPSVYVGVCVRVCVFWCGHMCVCTSLCVNAIPSLHNAHTCTMSDICPRVHALLLTHTRIKHTRMHIAPYLHFLFPFPSTARVRARVRRWHTGGCALCVCTGWCEVSLCEGVHAQMESFAPKESPAHILRTHSHHSHTRTQHTDTHRDKPVLVPSFSPVGAASATAAA